MNEIPSSNRLAKVRKVSRVLRIACWVMMSGVALLGLGTIFAPLLQRAAPGDAGTAFVMISLVSLMHIAVLVGLYCLERLFRSLSRGNIFTNEGTVWLKRFGYWMLIMSGVALVLQSIPLFIATMGPGPGLGIALMTLGYPLGWVFVGLFMVVLSWLLEEAQELREEQALTV